MIAALVVFGLGYIFLLNHEERIMEEYYDKLKTTNPVLYLSEIRQAQGFKVFLPEYLDINDYSAPLYEAPPFLVGRWSLFAIEKRVGDDFIPDSCLTSLEIEDGRLRVLGEHERKIPAAYTMAGDKATAHLEDGTTALIRVVAYGSHVHHIEVQGLAVNGEDRDRTWYGYLCH